MSIVSGRISLRNVQYGNERKNAVASRVNLDALIPREDFEFTPDEDDDAPTPSQITIRQLERRDFFYLALRKPDFQRETLEWEPKRAAATDVCSSLGQLPAPGFQLLSNLLGQVRNLVN
jgi:hypothetical protein